MRAHRFRPLPNEGACVAPLNLRIGLTVMIVISRCLAAVNDPAQSHKTGGVCCNGRSAIGLFCELREDRTCLVRQVTKDGPAEHAGLQAGDVLLEPDSADPSATVLTRIAQARIGTTIRVPFERKGKRKQLTINVEDQLAIALHGARLGDSSAENTIGDIYANALGMPQDYREAMNWYLKAAAKNFAPAQMNVGRMYESGYGVPKDVQQALRWYRQAASQDYSWAEARVGYAYFAGEGVPQDREAAFAWYAAAAKEDLPDAEAMLGYMYLNGFGVNKDPLAALGWYRKSAEQQDVVAFFGLGDMYANGVGVPNDHAVAADWYRKAADKGYAPAEYDVGMMYAKGDGVPKDIKTAASWLKKAAEHGDPRAKQALEQMQP
jgi:TPR repeat protein